MKARMLRWMGLLVAVAAVFMLGALAVSQGWVAPRALAESKTPTVAKTTAATTAPATPTPTTAITTTAATTVVTGTPTVTVTAAITDVEPTVAKDTTLPRTITVVGEGSVSIKPDIARVMIGVDTVGDSVKKASAESAKTMEAIIATFTKAGVADKDIQTSGYNVWVDLGRTPEGELTGKATYHVNNMVQVTVRKLDDIGSLLDGAIEAGANAVNGVTFAVDDTSKLETEARQKAAADALAKAKELAGLHNGQVGGVISISEIVAAGGGYYANTLDSSSKYQMGMGGGAGPVTPGELELSLSLQVVYELK
jgi:uncharacterized protein YggE